jgi:hypothetical protein
MRLAFDERRLGTFLVGDVAAMADIADELARRVHHRRLERAQEALAAIETAPSLLEDDGPAFGHEGFLVGPEPVGESVVVEIPVGLASDSSGMPAPIRVAVAALAARKPALRSLEDEVGRMSIIAR